MTQDERKKMYADFILNLREAFVEDNPIQTTEALQKAYGQYIFLTRHHPSMDFNTFAGRIQWADVEREKHKTPLSNFDVVAFAKERLWVD